MYPKTRPGKTVAEVWAALLQVWASLGYCEADILRSLAFQVSLNLKLAVRTPQHCVRVALFRALRAHSCDKLLRTSCTFLKRKGGSNVGTGADKRGGFTRANIRLLERSLANPLKNE